MDVGRHDPHMEDHEQMLPAFNPFCMSYDSFRACDLLITHFGSGQSVSPSLQWRTLSLRIFRDVIIISESIGELVEPPVCIAKLTLSDLRFASPGANPPEGPGELAD